LETALKGAKREEITMKDHERKEFERLEELRKTIEASPLTQQIKAEKAAAILATRTEAAGKIEVVKKERDEVIPKLQADIDAKEAKYKKAKAEMEAAGSEFQAARGARSSESQSFDSAISRQEQILIETADPAIDEAIQFFRDKLDYFRKPGRISSNRLGGERNIFTEKVTIKAESNADAVNSAVRYCMAAIKELEKMKLTPELDLQKIEAIKAAIPDIGIYTESTGEKPLPGSKGVNPLHLLKSDSQLDWELGKLNEKFKKIMGK
jgi:hypothetical protein